MKRVFTRLILSLPVCLISGLLSAVALTWVEYISALILLKVGLVGGLNAQIWFGSVPPQWGFCAFYFAVGCAVGCIIWFKDFPIREAALYGAGLCYFSMGAMLTYFTYKAILVGPSVWSFGVGVSFLIVRTALAGVGGAVVGSLSWVACQRAGAFRRRGILT